MMRNFTRFTGRRSATVALLAVFALAPLSTYAQTADITALIAQLQAQIAAIQVQIQALQAGQQPSAPPAFVPSLPSPVAPSTAFCPNLARSLYLGLEGLDVKELQQFLRELGYFTYPTNTGFFGPATERAVQDFQTAQGIVSSGDPETTGFGVVGRQTRDTIAKECGVIEADETVPPIPPSQLNKPPVVSGVSGPTVLNVNQVGTWTVNAYDPEKGALSYSVIWGDEYLASSAQGTAMPYMLDFSQQATFTHSYSQAGKYTPTFTVTDNMSNTAKTSVTVTVGGSTTTNRPPKIIGFPAVPSDIQVGQKVSFSWTAQDPDNDNLAWSVDWGDGIGESQTCTSPVPGGGGAVSTIGSTQLGPETPTGASIFTRSHAWQTAGTYTVTATVFDCRGGIDQSSFKVDVGLVPPPPPPLNITVLSPNGGEMWIKKTTQTIKWQDNTPIAVPLCEVEGTCRLPVRNYDITLLPYYPPCTGEICPAYPYIAPYTIAKGAYGSSYNWTVGKILDAYGGTGNMAPVGSYAVQVCQTGSTTCDSSDNYFRVVVAPAQVQILNPRMNDTSVPINTITGVYYSYTARNDSGMSLSNVVEQRWIKQGNTAYRAAGGEFVSSCGAGFGVLPVGSCDRYGSFFASDAESINGFGKFTNGPAAAIIQIKQGEKILAEHSFSVTLVGAVTQPSITLIYPKDGYTWYLEDQNFEFDWSASNFGSSPIFVYLQTNDDKYIPVALTVPNTGSYILPKLIPLAGSIVQAFSPGSYKAVVCGQFQTAASATYSVCSNTASVKISSRTFDQPSITVTATSGSLSSQSSLNIKVGDTLTISGTPQNLGSGFTRAFFFDSIFNDSCTNNSASDSVWTLQCTARQAGTGNFYITIYQNDLTYRSNTIQVTIEPTTQTKSVSLSATPTSGAAPLVVSFTGQLTNFPGCGNTITWTWGDNTSESLSEYCSGIVNVFASRTITRSHNYQTPGTYLARLTVGGTPSNDVSVTATSVSTTQPSITVLSPNGGEQWQIGSTQTVRWSGGGSLLNLIDLAITNSDGIVIYGIASVPNSGSYSWLIPSSIAIGNYKMRACTISGLTKLCDQSDSSDAPFSIVAETPPPPPVPPLPPPTITVAPTPIAQTVSAGTNQFTFANYVVSAPSGASGATMTNLPAYLRFASAPETLTNCKLYDEGGIVLTTGSHVVNPYVSGLNAFTLDAPLTIQIGTSRALSLKCDVVTGAQPGTGYAWGLIDTVGQTMIVTLPHPAAAVTIVPIGEKSGALGQFMSFMVEATNNDATKPLMFSATGLQIGSAFLPLGDVSGNGMLGSLDASYILRYASGTISFSDTQKAIADINRDGSITKADADYILEIGVGQRPKPDVYVFTWTPTPTGAGLFQITFSVTRSDGASARETVPITIRSTTAANTSSLLSASVIEAMLAQLSQIQRLLDLIR